MDGAEGLGAGIAALAFWGFISAMVVGGIWDGAKKREAQHETLRRMIESGKPVDEALMTKLFEREPTRPHRGLAIGAIIVFSVAAGLVVLGALIKEPAVLGAAGICACLSAGLLGASVYVRRAQAAEDAQSSQQSNAG